MSFENVGRVEVCDKGFEALNQHGLIALKYSASQSDGEQGPGLSHVFPSSKSLNKSTTAEHISSD